MGDDSGGEQAGGRGAELEQWWITATEEQRWELARLVDYAGEQLADVEWNDFRGIGLAVVMCRHDLIRLAQYALQKLAELPPRCRKPECYAHDDEACAAGEMRREDCEHWPGGDR
jgi:hypothetical protein